MPVIFRYSVKIIVLGGLVLISANTQATPQLTLDLSHFHDPSCQYETSANAPLIPPSYQLQPTTTVTPGECIIYQLALSNQGTSSAHQIKLNAPIPAHTRLMTPPKISGDVLAISVASPDFIELTIADLAPQQAQALVLSYRVRVD